MAVVGHGTDPLDPPIDAAAEEVGRLLAVAGAIVVCGGLGGVMAATARGVARAGGTVIGLLPGRDRSEANPWVTHAVATGLGEARNALVVSNADAVIAVAGEYGTLSEIALALRNHTTVVGLGTWEISPGDDPDRPDPIRRAGSPQEAVTMAMDAAREAISRSG